MPKKKVTEAVEEVVQEPVVSEPVPHPHPWPPLWKRAAAIGRRNHLRSQPVTLSARL